MTTKKKQDFIELLAPKAQALQSQYGVPASIAIAQAILESGWGERAEGNNIYGVKAGGSWNGSSKAVATREYIGGVWHNITDGFRAYDSIEASMQDYAKLLSGKSRYSAVVKASNANEAADALQRAGYATDPKYAAHLKAIIASNDLTRFDDVKYRGYTEDDRFSETRQRLSDQRAADPGPWKELESLFAQLISAILSSISSMFSGTQIAASGDSNDSLPRKTASRSADPVPA